MSTIIDRDIRNLHPKFAGVARALEEQCALGYQTGETETLFKIFEGYRSPLRQNNLLASGQGVTKAGGWQSPHQFGLAADFVPFMSRDTRGVELHHGWSWDDGHPWEYLRKKAEALGLRRPITWDLAHIESPLWLSVRDVLR